MISPTRIEVRWIGSVEHAVIEPHPNGITALDGPTGAGKSTLLNAVAFALYGYIGGVNAFVRQGELRSDFCPAGETAEASVEFPHGGATWRAVRRLRRSKSGKETASAELWIDGEKQPGISPDKLTEKIITATGMSGRAFTSAYFIPQMHLERLAHGTPGDIQSLIEEQTGLTALTRHLATAAQQVRDAQQRADALPGSPDEVAAAQKLVDDAQQQATALWDVQETARERAAAATAVWEQAHALHTALQARRDASRAAEVQLARLEARHEALTGQRYTAEAELAGCPDGDVTSLQTRRGELQTAARSCQQALADWQRSTQTLTAAEQQLAAARTALDQMGDPAVWQDKADTAAHLLDAARDRYADAGAAKRTARAALDALSVAHDGATELHTCPMCAQPVADASQLRDQLTRDEQAADRQARQALQDRAEATAQQDEARAGLDAITEAARAVTHAEQTASRVGQDRARIGADGKTAGAALRALLSANSTALLPGLITAAHTECDQLTDQIAVLQRRDQLAATIRELDTQLQSMESDMAAAREAAADVVPEAEWVAASTDVQQARTEKDIADRDAAAATRDASVAAQQVTGCEQDRDRAQQRLDAKIDALTAAEVLRAAHDALCLQRRELLAEYTASISDAATAVMEQAGGGTHVGVLLDETFVPKVVLADGRTRPFGNCSGGEKLRAALCLCLGQVAQHDRGGAGMLFADEIATGYDAVTTTAVMDMIAGLGRPMVLIGHQEATRQIANRVYDVTNTDGRTEVTMAS